MKTIIQTSFLSLVALSLVAAWGALETACQSETTAALGRVADYAAGRTAKLDLADASRVGSIAPLVHKAAIERVDREIAASKPTK